MRSPYRIGTKSAQSCSAKEEQGTWGDVTFLSEIIKKTTLELLYLWGGWVGVICSSKLQLHLTKELTPFRLEMLAEIL